MIIHLCKVIGIGAIILRMVGGTKIRIDNVRYVPDLNRNLISLGMINNASFSFKGEWSMIKVTKGSLTVLKGKKVNGLYVAERLLS